MGLEEEMTKLTKKRFDQLMIHIWNGGKIGVKEHV